MATPSCSLAQFAEFLATMDAVFQKTRATNSVIFTCGNRMTCEFVTTQLRSWRTKAESLVNYQSRWRHRGMVIWLVDKQTRLEMRWTYLLTPWCRVLPEQLTGLQLIKKFPAFYGTRRFITALTSVRHLSLSWASPIQFIYPHPTSWRSILILSTHLRLGLPPVSPPRPLSPHPYAPHAQPISFFSILSPAQYWVSSTDHLVPRLTELYWYNTLIVWRS